MPNLRREYAPFIGYVALVASSLFGLGAAVLYNGEYIDFLGLILPVLALPWGFASFALMEMPLLWVITTVGGILLNAWLLWRDGRARLKRSTAAGLHHGAAV